METSALFAKLNKLTNGGILERQRFGRSQAMSVWVEARRLSEIALLLKTDDNFDLDWLENISAVQMDRAFAVSYFLRSRKSGLSLVLRCSIDAPGERDAEVTLESVAGIWEAAAQFEAEIEDLFGIGFLRAGSKSPGILMSGLTGDKGFGGFPLRKEYSSKLFPREGR